MPRRWCYYLRAGCAAAASGPDCWTGSITYGHCCNEIFGPRGNAFCWDAGEFTFESCCGGITYRASSCQEFVTNFGFSSLRYAPDSLETCAARMESDPANCNSPNATRYSCPACGAVSEHLVTYIRCVKQEQERPGSGGLGSSAQSLSAASSSGSGSPVFVSGDHHPTLIRPRGTHEFSYVAAAFDAYVGDELIHAGHWMPQETALLCELLNPDEVAVDAGANIGGFTLPFARRVGPGGEVHSFEPFRLTYQLLTANCALNGLQSCYTHQKGLGRQPAKKWLRMPGFNGAGNPSKMFVADSVASEMHIHYDRREEEVEVVRLDDVGLRQLHLLKIDVESMELDLLLGAEQVIAMFKPIIYVEDSEAGDLINMREPTAVMRLLADRHGYVCLNLAQSGLPSMTSLLCMRSERVAEVQAKIATLQFAG